MQFKEMKKMSTKKFTEVWKKELSKEACDFTQNLTMIKLVSTIDDKGWPHITFISNNKAKSPNQIVWGEFMHGKSKRYIQDNPKHGYFYMSGEKPLRMLQIKANFSHILKAGEDLDEFNNSSTMRYNNTVNVWRAFYGNVVSVSPFQKISIGKLIKGIIFSMWAKGAAKSGMTEERLDQFGKGIFTGAMNPKFLAFIDPDDGYPIVLPCFQAIAADYTRLVFPPTMFKEQLAYIPENSKVAVYGLNSEFIAQTVKGTFLGYKKYRGVTLGSVNIEEVYNAGPPLPGVIYPEIEVLPEVTDFEMPIIK
jgi:hypothetical protein